MFGTVWSGFWGVSLCCVSDSLEWVWRSECVLSEGLFGVGLGELVCVVCGTVWSGFGGVRVLCVGLFVVGLSECVCVMCGTA